MLQKQDIILLLTNLEEQGVDVENELIKVATSSSIPLDVVSFINKRQQLDITKFYEKIRKSYNNKKNTLYKNLIHEDINIENVLTTLSSFILQINIFSQNVEKKNLGVFYRNARVEEITNALTEYYKNYNIIPAVKLLKLLRCDLLAFEYANGRRDELGKLITN